MRFQSARRPDGSDSTEDLKARRAAASDGSDSAVPAEEEKAARRKRARTSGIVGECREERGILGKEVQMEMLAEEARV